MTIGEKIIAAMTERGLYFGKESSAGPDFLDDPTVIEISAFKNHMDDLVAAHVEEQVRLRMESAAGNPPRPRDRIIGKYRLELLVGGFPEQYEVWDGELSVGYLHHRHGTFHAVYCLNDGDEETEVFTAKPENSPAGNLETEADREKYLTLGVQAIDAARNKSTRSILPTD